MKGILTMANNDNLTSFSERSENELKELTSKGGKASGKTRAIKAIANKYGELAAPADTVAELIQNEAIENGQTISYDEAMILAQYQKAFKGNTKAAEFLCKVKGEYNIGVDINSVNIDDESSRAMADYFARHTGGDENE